MGDLRTFIGAFFVLLGALLLFAPNAHAPLTEGPVNLYSGLAMVAFGVIMMWLGIRAARIARRHD
jgi:hypothetical protein